MANIRAHQPSTLLFSGSAAVSSFLVLLAAAFELYALI